MDIREATFLLRKSICWTADQYNAYWPLVDNFWVCNKPNQAITKKGTQLSYWYCRLHKGETVSETHNQRNKALRHVDPYRMKLKLMKTYIQLDYNSLESIKISRYVDKKYLYYNHNHGRDYVD